MMENLKSVTGNHSVAEIGLTYKSQVNPQDWPLVNKPKLAHELLIKHWDPNTIELLEEFKVLLLNQAKRAIALMNVASGGLNSVMPDARLVFMAALQVKATSIILAHNHPSCIVAPSTSDLNYTSKMVTCGKLLEIEVVDHLIITRQGFYSFAENGEL